MTPSLPKVKDAVVRTPKGFRCRLSQRLLQAEARHSMTSRLPKVKDAVVQTPRGFRCRLSQRLLQAEVRHSMTSRLPKVKDAVVRTPKRIPLPSLSEISARGDGALDDVETAEGEGRRCPNT